MSFKKFLLAVLSVPNSNASFRDRTNLEIKWHRVMHQVFINDAMVEQTKAAVENLEKVKKGLLNFYKSLEEKKDHLERLEEKVSRFTNTKPVIKPKFGFSMSS